MRFIASILLAMALSGCGGGGGGSNSEGITPPAGDGNGGGDGGQDGGNGGAGGQDGGDDGTGGGNDNGGSMDNPVPRDLSVRIVNAFPGISFNRPLIVRPAPGDASQLFVASQTGLIQTFPARPDVGPTEVSTFLDLRDRTRAAGEQGLLGLTFDPGFKDNGFVYVHYNNNNGPSGSSPGDTVIARFTANPLTRTADPTTEVQLLRFAQPFGNHNGGSLEIGPDGHLYLASGDGGSGNDPQNTGQRLDTLLGKILRIRTDGTSPADNPFVGQSEARNEIWAYGLRNPFRMSFDSVTGRLWVGDVGQGAEEEIDIIERGANYGWRIFEGFRCNTGASGQTCSSAPPNPDDFVAPVLSYLRDQGQSVTGGQVYRGSSVPDMVGYYVYGDFVSGNVWALLEQDGSSIDNQQLGTVPNPSSFGSGLDGEILITAFDGNIYRFLPGESEEPPPPQALSETGLFADLDNLEPAPGLLEYLPNAEFWSDGAEKRRWLELPEGETIAFSAESIWSFPVGTRLVKHFELTEFNGGQRHLETRIFERLPSGWRGNTYQWNDAQTDAMLIRSGASITLSIDNGSGTAVDRSYQIPPESACLQCHTAVSGTVLGLNTRQLNGSFPNETGTPANQLETFDRLNLFDQNIGAASMFQALANPAEPSSGSIEARARAYLEANCSHCHVPGGPTPLDMDLRALIAINDTNTINVPPTGESFGVADARRISPGNAAQSLIWHRMMSRDDDVQMPPLGSEEIDDSGVSLTGQWIQQGAN